MSLDELDTFNGPPGSDTGSPLELLQVIWQRKWIVVGALILCVAVAVGLDSRKAKQYSATSTLEFRDPGFDAALLNGNTLFNTDSDPTRTVQTNADVISSPSVAALVQQQLHTKEPISSLVDSILVTPSAIADVATIKATRSSPQDAANVANAFADGYITYRQDTDRQAIANAVTRLRGSLATATPSQIAAIQTSLSTLQTLETLQTGDAELVAPATPDYAAVSPNVSRDALFAVIIGLLLGVSIAFLVDRLDQRLKTTEDIERAYDGYPVVAAVPHAPAQNQPPQLDGAAGEAYRMLREGLRFLDATRASRCFVVTSAAPNEGKSTVAVNLASSLAAAGQRVILIEADLRHPTAAVSLGAMAVGRPGLSDLLISHDALQDFLIGGLQESTLTVLPSGTRAPNPSDLMLVGRMSEVIAEARELADVVVIDTPPLLPVADTRVLLQMAGVDRVVLVARVGVTRRDHAHRARDVLLQSGRTVVALVVTDVHDSIIARSRHPAEASRRPREHVGVSDA
jgi:polysaccharide biosynthesis transport protein